MALSERKKKILKSVLKQHERSGEPVASEKLAKKSGLGISSATLRHELAELEELGYLFHPHASSGRIPTEEGYRFYVHELMALDPFDEEAEQIFRFMEHRSAWEMDDFLRNTVANLAEITGAPSFAVAPRLSETKISGLELVPVTAKKVLAITVTDSGQVKQKMITLTSPIVREDLKTISGLLQETFKGRKLSEIQQSLLSRLEQEKEKYGNLLRQAIALSRQWFALEEAEDEIYLEGLPLLLKRQDMDVEEVRSVLDFLSQPSVLGSFLQGHAMDAGLTVFIGSENPVPVMRHLSMIISPYRLGGNQAGALGIIGPMRMDYDRVAGMVDATAHRINILLEKY